MEDPGERKIKRKKIHGHGRKLSVGEKVEVSYFDDGLFGSWHLGEVVAIAPFIRVIKHAYLLNEKESGKLVEEIPVSPAIEGVARTTEKYYRNRIRPLPPQACFPSSVLRYGLCVEAFVKEAWWEGVIFDHNMGSEERRVFFPDLGDQSILSIDQLRITQDWNEVLGEWNVRGDWLLLKVLRRFEEQGDLPVSIREIWYDIRTKPSFLVEVKEWIFGTHDMWFTFVSELLQELWSVVSTNPASNMVPSDLQSDDYRSLLLARETLKIGVLDSSAQQSLGDQTAKDSVQLLYAKSICSSSHLHEHKNKSLDCAQTISRNEEYQDMHSPGVNDNQVSIAQSAESNSTLTVNKRRLDSYSKTQISWKLIKVDSKHCPDANALYSYILKDRKSDIEHSKFSSLNKNEHNVILRQHLVSLDWKIYWRNDDMPRFRYHSPDGKHYYSLRLVCRALLEGHNYSSRIMNDLDPLSTNDKPLSSCQENSSTLISASDAQAGNLSKQNGFLYSPDIATSRMPDTAQPLTDTAQPLTDYPHHQFSMSQPVGLSKDFNAALNAQAGDPPKQNDWSISSYLSDNLTPPTKSAAWLMPDEAERKTQDPLKISGSYNVGFSMSVPLNPRNPTKMRTKSHHNMLSRSSSWNSKQKQMKRKEELWSSSRQVSRSKGGLSLVLRSGKRSRNVKTDQLTSVGQQSAKTVLSWLVERNVLLPRQKVYDECKTDSQKIKRGQISRDEIKCFCCNKFFTIASFDAHAGNQSLHPSANIYLNDGKSLLDCQIQMMNTSKHTGFQHKRMKGDYRRYENDEICSICHYGGNIILCDSCPSSFHTDCLGLKDLPEGNWFCPSCKCGICGIGEYEYNIEQFTERTVLYCDQCEKEYHVGCLRENRLQSLSNCPTGEWFCSKKCSKIFHSLRKLIGKPYPTHMEGLSCTILRWNSNDIICPATKAEHHSKLRIALDVMHECFVTMIEPYTRSDFVEDVLFNRESELKRLNFWGFYSMLLEKGDELVCVASFRVYDGKAAEMPFVGTRVKFRRQGMCRLLLRELEKLLYGLGVERLLLPAVPQLLETWTTSFGFSKLENSDKLELSDYTILNFQDTTMCQKFLNTGRTLSTKYRGLGSMLDDRSRRNKVQNTEPSSLGVTEDLRDVSGRIDALHYLPLSNSTEFVVEKKQDEMIEAPVLSVLAGIHESTKFDKMFSSTEPSSLEVTENVEEVSCRGDNFHYLPLTSSTNVVIETKQDEMIKPPVLSVCAGIHVNTKLDKMSPSRTEPSSLEVTENVEDASCRGDASHYLLLNNSTDLAIETKQDEMIEAPVLSLLAGVNERTKLEKMSSWKADINSVIDLSSKFSGKFYERRKLLT